MRKFLVKILIFFAIIAIVDYCSGTLFSFFLGHAKGGDSGRSNYICDKVNEDVLVFGSSRAIHHYNPVIISDSLGLSCYNCGETGNGVILNYGRYQLICQRYSPKILIYDVIPTFDYLVGVDNHQYLGKLRPYYDRRGIPEIFNSVDNKEKYKMRSCMYRYNSRFVQILSDYIHPMQSVGIRGFRPLKDEMDTMKIGRKERFSLDLVCDSLKLNYLKKMIELSGHTKIIFTVSPYWNGLDTAFLSPIKEICQDYQIPIIDFSNSEKYVHHNEFFNDGVHLNARGADEFTRDLVIEIKKRKLVQ